MSTTHIALLDAAGRSEGVVGVSGLKYVSNADVRGRLDSRADVGYEGNVNYETMAALQPDLVLLYGISGPSAMEAKLDELGIPYMYVGDYTEESPLGKAEWMVALGYATGAERSADSAFTATAERYCALMADSANWASTPAVMINMPYNDTWYMPSTRSYQARLIADAGGRYIYPH
ncbi:MAG: ABC transporter substrate-binding protein, partial [Roseburia sp.]|nr:ABC transporter substrate-binding protein [Roseburia sp.]